MAQVGIDAARAVDIANGDTTIIDLGAGVPKKVVGALVVTNVGAGATIVVYDNTSGTTKKRWSWATADGPGYFPIHTFFEVGIRTVVTLGGAEAYLTIGE